MTKTPDIYDLDELIKKLEKIFEEKDGSLNYPKAFYTLALLIKKLNIKIESFYE